MEEELKQDVMELSDDALGFLQENTEENVAEILTELIEQKQFAQVKKIFSDLPPADIATVLSEFPSEKLLLLFRLLPKDLAADTFVEMSSDDQAVLLAAFTDHEVSDVVNELFLDDTVDIIEEMPANVVRRILKHVDAETRRSVNEILNYPQDSAGSIMTTEYVRLDENITVEDAIKRIRRTGVDKETIYTCYVTRPDRTLIGIVTAKNLLLAEEEAILSDIMTTGVISVTTDEDKEEVANEMSRYDLLAIPVVDKENRLVGIITVDDAIDVMQEEATEDIEKMAAIVPSDKPYLETGIFATWKKRIPWLLLLMVSATFTGQIITTFESGLQAFPALIAFIPMLMDTGGNAGGQASVTIIRGLALNEIRMRDVLVVLWKEIRVSVICGLTLAAANFVKIILIDKMLFNTPITIPEITVVCLTLIAAVICAKIVGCMLPILAKRIGFDPAVMASPFITTIVDAISLLVYFGVAVLILKV